MEWQQRLAELWIPSSVAAEKGQYHYATHFQRNEIPFAVPLHLHPCPSLDLACWLAAESAAPLAVVIQAEPVHRSHHQ
jgi:hypothetical protein